MKRLGVKGTGYSGQRRIFFLFDRGTRKFHGDIRLWMQYLDYARSQKAHKKVGKILTSVLRLHPTKSELWIVAANYSVESQSDIGAGRGYMQRGLRFCPKERTLWLEYAKLEMLYIAKTADNLRVLGVKDSRDIQEPTTEADNLDADEIALPTLTSEDINPSLAPEDPEDQIALQNLAATPALSGQIPIAIFDAAMKEFNGEAILAEGFFDRVAQFPGLLCCQKILGHIVRYLSNQSPITPSSAICSFKQPLIGIDPTSSKFPAALRQALQAIRASIQKNQNNQDRERVAREATLTLLPIVDHPDLDPEIQKVILSILTQSVKVLGSGDAVSDLVDMLRKRRKGQEAQRLLSIGTRQYPGHARLSPNSAVLAIEEVASDA
jgi:U3 small nucleolar RNA-associated protein 6